MASFTSLADYAQIRDAVLDRILRLLQDDARVLAAWLSGSFGRGEADAWSDLDLHIVVADAHYPAFLEERTQLYPRVGPPLLIQSEMPSHSMPGGRFQLVIYPGPVEVDWNVGPYRHALRPVAFQMLMERTDIPIMTLPPLSPVQRQEYAAERLTFFWAMAPIAVKYAGRGETRRAVPQIDLLSRAFIALWRLVEQPEGPDPWLPGTNRVMEPALHERLPQLGETIDPTRALATITALCREVDRLHSRLAAFGVTIPTAMSAEVATLVQYAVAEIGRDERASRKYR